MEPFYYEKEVEQGYDEDGNSYWYNPEGFYDWYQIGGRWTGAHDKNFKPSDDENNLEDCQHCDGTNSIDEPLIVDTDSLEDESNTEIAASCPHCNNKGKVLKWPTQWARFHGDIISVEKAADDLKCCTLIVDDEVWHEQEDRTVKQILKEYGITSGYLITIDYHS